MVRRPWRRGSWLEAMPPPPAQPSLAGNPFAPPDRGPAFNPFNPNAGSRPAPGSFLDPFADTDDAAIDNPFAPKRDRGPALPSDAPRKLQLLVRGKAVFGSYAKVLETDGAPAVW